MNRLIVVIFMLLWQPVFAQTVRVLSGEHATFTRLAMVMPGLQSWSLAKTDAGYDLRVEPSRMGFDTRGVFDLVPRTRLADLAAVTSGGVLSLVLGCDCHAVATQVRPGVVAIDIFDGPAPLVFASEQAARENLTIFELLPDAPSFRPRPRPGRKMDPAIPDFLRQGLWRSRGLPAEFVEGLGVAAGPEADLADNPFAAALLKALSRATLAGALEPAPSLGSLPSRPLAAESAIASQQMQIRLASGRIVFNSPESEACPDDALFDVVAWTDARPFTIQLAEFRAGLIQEFDRPDTDTVLRLSRFYLASGFGVEATNAIKELAPDIPEGLIIADIANILDDQQEPSAMLHGFRACDGRVALWAIMALPEPTQSERIEIQAVVRTFSELPLHLRKELGPRLVETLFAINESGAAQQIRSALGRASGSEGPELAIMTARIAIDAGHEAEAEALLAQTGQSTGPLAPVALIELVDFMFSRGLALDEQTLVLLESHANEGRRTRLGPELNEALAKAVFLSGDLGRAFALAGQNNLSLHEALLDALATTGSTGDVLQYGAPLAPALLAQLANSTRMAMADRFLGLGFPDLAQGWIGPAQVPPDSVLVGPDVGQARQSGPVLVDAGGTAPGRAPPGGVATAIDDGQLAGTQSADVAIDPSAGGAEPPVMLASDVKGPLAKARLATERAALSRAEIERLLEAAPRPAR
jgi:hypothetical protein